MMKFSMNGFRRNLHSDVEELREIAKSIIDNGRADPDESEELMNAVNNMIIQSNTLNCVSIKDDPNFLDMSSLELQLLETDDSL